MENSTKFESIRLTDFDELCEQRIVNCGWVPDP